MALKLYPTTPSQRQLVIVDRSGLHRGAPVKTAGRRQKLERRPQQHRRTTMRFRGGGHKRPIARSISSVERSTCRRGRAVEYDTEPARL